MIELSMEEDAMLPPAEEEMAPPAAPAGAAPALPQMAVAQVTEPMGEVLQPDLSQLNAGREFADIQEDGQVQEEKAVPVAA